MLPRAVAAKAKTPDAARVEHIAQVLRSGEPTLIVLAGHSTRGRALELAGKLKAATGCRIATQFFTARIERGAGRVPLERIPYAVGQAVEYPEGLQAHRHGRDQRADRLLQLSRTSRACSSRRVPVCIRWSKSARTASRVLRCWSKRSAQRARAAAASAAYRDATPPTGALGPASIAQALAAALPENCILVDESLTTGRETMGLTVGAAPHDLINNMGGSIGYGTPVATGAALACPDRRVFCMVGDGSAMYTIQSLWTQAREGLNITTIIFANNSYAILKAEYANMGAGAPGRACAGHDRYRSSAYRLAGHGEKHGRARCRRRDGRSLPQGDGRLGERARSLPHRGQTVNSHSSIRTDINDNDPH